MTCLLEAPYTCWEVGRTAVTLTAREEFLGLCLELSSLSPSFSLTYLTLSFLSRSLFLPPFFHI